MRGEKKKKEREIERDLSRRKQQEEKRSLKKVLLWMPKNITQVKRLRTFFLQNPIPS
jgi:hypothetical protein